MSDPTEAEPDWVAAHAALTTAINAFYAAIAPTHYVDAWVLVSHKLAPEMEANHTSGVGVTSSRDMPWLIRRALLDVALQNEQDELR